MQENQDGGHQSTYSGIDYAAEGVLEDPATVEIVNNGKLMARLEEPTRAASDHAGVFSKDRFSAKLYQYKRLLWSHTGSLLVLQGMPVPQILGDWVMLAGTHRPTYHPLPGADGVVMAHVVDNPGHLEPAHLFFELRQALKM